MCPTQSVLSDAQFETRNLKSPLPTSPTTASSNLQSPVRPASEHGTVAELSLVDEPICSQFPSTFLNTYRSMSDWAGPTGYSIRRMPTPLSSLAGIENSCSS